MHGSKLSKENMRRHNRQLQSSEIRDRRDKRRSREQDDLDAVQEDTIDDMVRDAKRRWSNKERRTEEGHFLSDFTDLIYCVLGVVCILLVLRLF
jgi:hypothetical protein